MDVEEHPWLHVHEYTILRIYLGHLEQVEKVFWIHLNLVHCGTYPDEDGNKR
jgi:hypothetical protein